MAQKYTLTSEDVAALQRTAQRLGVSDRDLATVIHYETIGTMNPTIKGGAGGAYQGLIQFGPSERKTYGYKPEMTFAQQVEGPVYNYLSGRGLKPGHGLAHMYSIILTGGLTKSGEPRWNYKDVNGSVKQHVTRMQRDSVPRVERMAFAAGVPLTGAQNAAAAMAASGELGTATLRQGKRGDEVRALQSSLEAAGFSPGKIDGDFGPATKAAVVAYQRANGLTPDGVVGPQTRGALANASLQNALIPQTDRLNIDIPPPTGLMPEMLMGGLNHPYGGDTGRAPAVSAGMLIPPTGRADIDIPPPGGLTPEMLMGGQGAPQQPETLQKLLGGPSASSAAPSAGSPMAWKMPVPDIAAKPEVLMNASAQMQAPGPTLGQQANRPPGTPPVPPMDVPDQLGMSSPRPLFNAPMQEPSTVPPGPWGAEKIIEAARSGDPAAVQREIDAFKERISAAPFMEQMGAQQQLTSYFDQTMQTAPGAVRQLQTAIAEPKMAAVVPEAVGGMLDPTFKKLPPQPTMPMAFPSLRPPTAGAPQAVAAATPQPPTPPAMSAQQFGDRFNPPPIPPGSAGASFGNSPLASGIPQMPGGQPGAAAASTAQPPPVYQPQPIEQQPGMNPPMPNMRPAPLPQAAMPNMRPEQAKIPGFIESLLKSPGNIIGGLANLLGGSGGGNLAQAMSGVPAGMQAGVRAATSSGQPYMPTGQPGAQGGGIVSGPSGTFRTNGDGTYTSLTTGKTFSIGN